MSEVRPPRAVFVDHPVARTFGRPGDRVQQEAILSAALAELPSFTQPGQIQDLRCQWLPDGSRAWETELREELLTPIRNSF